MSVTTSLEIKITQTQNSKLDTFNQNELAFGKVFSDHMFVADFVNGKWQDLRIEPFADLVMSPANSMIHYGQSIFEGLKAYKGINGEVLTFRPEMNAARMNESAIRMCMAELPQDIFMEGLKALLTIDKDWIPSVPGSSLYIRPFMFAMDNVLGVRPSESYRFMIIASPSGAYYSEPVRVKIENHFSRACAGGTGAAKAAGNYAAALYPSKLAKEQGFHQLIWTDAKEHKYIEEAGTMNVMFMLDGKLVTSPLTATILPGVTRDSVLKLVASWGYEVEERRLSVDELIEGAKSGKLTEAFGVGTAATIAQISAIGYEDEIFELPAVESREVSPRIFQFMEDVKRGKIADEFGWIMEI